MSIYPSGEKQKYKDKPADANDNQVLFFSDANIISDKIEAIESVINPPVETTLVNPLVFDQNRIFKVTQTEDIDFTVAVSGHSSSPVTQVYQIIADGSNLTNSISTIDLVGDALNTNATNTIIAWWDGTSLKRFSNQISDVQVSPVNITVVPVDGAVDQDATTTIVFTADKNIVLLNGDPINDTNVDALITLAEDNALGTPIAFDATVTIADQQITVTPNSDLPDETSIYCSLDGVRAEDGGSANTPVETTFTTASSGGISGLVAQWQFEDDLLDSSGNGYTLSAANSGTPVYSADVATGGLTKSFDWVNFLVGSSGDSLRSAAPLGNEMTLFFRYKNTGATSGANRFTGSSLANFQTRQRGFQNVLDVLYYDGSSTQQITSGAIPTASNTWGSFAVTVDMVAGEIELFMDGVSDGLNSGLTIADLSGDVLFIGETSTSIPGGVMKTFQDDVRIYNNVLTAQQILDIHNGIA